MALARRARLRHIATLAVMVALPGAAAAEWRSVAHAEAHSESGGRAAQAVNEDGYRLTIFMQDAGTLIGVLQLPGGLAALDELGCPTLAVDDTTPERLHDPAGRCQPNGRRARIRIAYVSDGAVDSQVLLQLLNGEQLTVRVRLKEAGYRETRFTLKGSKQALKSALPPGTVVVGD